MPSFQEVCAALEGAAVAQGIQASLLETLVKDEFTAVFSEAPVQTSPVPMTQTRATVRVLEDRETLTFTMEDRAISIASTDVGRVVRVLALNAKLALAMKARVLRDARAQKSGGVNTEEVYKSMAKSFELPRSLVLGQPAHASLASLRSGGARSSTPTDPVEPVRDLDACSDKEIEETLYKVLAAADEDFEGTLPLRDVLRMLEAVFCTRSRGPLTEWDVRVLLAQMEGLEPDGMVRYAELVTKIPKALRRVHAESLFSTMGGQTQHVHAPPHAGEQLQHQQHQQTAAEGDLSTQPHGGDAADAGSSTSVSGDKGQITLAKVQEMVMLLQDHELRLLDELVGKRCEQLADASHPELIKRQRLAHVLGELPTRISSTEKALLLQIMPMRVLFRPPEEDSPDIYKLDAKGQPLLRQGSGGVLRQGSTVAFASDASKKDAGSAPSSPGGENREGTKKGPMTFVNFTQFKENLAYIRASRTFYFPNNLAQIRATIVAHIAETKLKSVIPIWHYRTNVLDTLIQNKNVWLSMSELYTIAALSPLSTVDPRVQAHVDVNVGVNVLLSLVSRWHSRDLVYAEGLAHQLEQEAERKRKEMEELQAFSGASPKSGGDRAEDGGLRKSTPLQNRDNMDMVEKALLQQFLVADSERRGFLPMDVVAPLILGDWDRYVEDGGLLDTEKAGLLAMCECVRDEEDKPTTFCVYEQHVKTWLPVIFDVRQSPSLRQLLELEAPEEQLVTNEVLQLARSHPIVHRGNSSPNQGGMFGRRSGGAMPRRSGASTTERSPSKGGDKKKVRRVQEMTTKGGKLIPKTIDIAPLVHETRADRRRRIGHEAWTQIVKGAAK
eukprot:g6220.t1